MSSVGEKPKRTIWSTALIGAVVLSVGFAYVGPGASEQHVAVAGLGAGTTNATAAAFVAPTAPTGNVQQSMVQYANATTRVSAPTLARLLRAANVNTIQPSSGLKLNPALAFADRTAAGAFSLRIPFVASNNVVDVSGYSVFLPSALKVQSTGESVFTALSAESGRLQLWQDGVPRLNTTASNSQSASPSNISPAFSWSKLNTCLNNSGISGWMVSVIGVAMGLFCAASLGIGCIIAVVAFAGVAGATMGRCIAKAMV